MFTTLSAQQLHAPSGIVGRYMLPHLFNRRNAALNDLTLAEALPYPAERFTKACTVNAIFSWRNAPQAISELWRVLANG